MRPARMPSLRVNVFEFYRLRFHFEALGFLIFPPGGSANLIRGALGECLRWMGPEAARIFRPMAARPSGLKLPPRPFVLRTLPLEGRALRPGEPFAFDLHVFERRIPVLHYFRQAFEMIAAEGLGPERSAIRFTGFDTLDLEGNPTATEFLCVAPLDPEGEAVRSVTMRFLTPTELKAQGQVLEEPEFRHLFARVRDRIAMLSALYGRSPLAFDFRELGERAAGVALERSNLTWEYAARKSKSTGQIHPLGGFTGTAEYRGQLAPFLPWLRAAQWSGVGRQTVWGKGEVLVAGVEAGSSKRPTAP
jgi:hypothetical protein